MHPQLGRCIRYTQIAADGCAVLVIDEALDAIQLQQVLGRMQYRLVLMGVD